MIKRKWGIMITLTMIVSLLLAACGGADDGAKEKGEDKGDKDGGTEQELNVNIKNEPPSLHPGKASDTTSGAVLDQIFEGLTRINQEGEPEEAMAEKIEVSDDGLTYTFTLRDANWSNGDPVTAEDFESAWKWVLNPDSPDTDYAYQLYPIKNAEEAKENGGSLDDVGITVKDEKTLVVELAQPTEYFLDLTAFHTFYPVNKSIVSEGDDWANNLTESYVTNGPFKMESWDHKDKIVLIKNEEYWDKDVVKLEKVNMLMIEDESTELQMYEKGELDWAGNPIGSLPLASIPTLKDSGDLNISNKAAVYYYTLNNEVAPFDNENIRKAFTLAVDRKSIVENITKGEQKPAMGLVPPTIFEENEEGYFKDNDLEEAKKYLEAGLKELGVDKLDTVKLSYNTDEGHQAIAQAIQDMWKNNLGVDVELNNEEWGVYLDSLGEGNYQVGRIGWTADFNDAINFLEIFETVGGNNYTNWEDKEYQALLKESRKELDADKRTAILKEAEAVLMDQMPIVPIYYYTDVYVYQDYVKNIKVSPLGIVQFKWGYIEK